MSEYKIIYKVFGIYGNCSCNIFENGSFKVINGSLSEEDLEDLNKGFENAISFFKEVELESGHYQMNYVPYQKKEQKAFETLCAIFNPPVNSPKFLEVAPKKYRHGLSYSSSISARSNPEQYPYVVEYFGKGEPWRNFYEGRETERPIP